jgi:hypothetical protein
MALFQGMDMAISSLLGLRSLFEIIKTRAGFCLIALLPQKKLFRCAVSKVAICVLRVLYCRSDIQCI